MIDFSTHVRISFRLFCTCFYLVFCSALATVASAIEFTPQEREFIENNPSIIVGGEMDWPPVDYVENGQHTGLANDYLQLIAEKTGIDIQIRTGFTWKELLQMLTKQEIDLLPALYHSKSREKNMHFTSAYLTLRHYVFTQNNRADLKGIEDLYFKTLAVPEGYSYIEDLQRDHPHITLTQVSSTLEAIDAVVTGQADAMIETTALISHFLKTHNIHGIKAAFPVGFGINRVHMATRQDMPLLRDIINKVLLDITESEKQQIAQRWVRFNQTTDTPNSHNLFSAEQLNYLAQKGTLKACIDPHWLPYEGFVNDKVSGMTSDYLRYIEEHLKTPIEVVRTTSWSETLDFAKTRRCDFITMASNKPERREYLSFTVPHMSAPLALAARIDEAFYSDFSELSGRKVGIMRGYSPAATIRVNYPEIKIIEYDSAVEALNDVHNGKILGYLDSVATLSYQIQNAFPATLKISGKFDYNWTFGMAARNDEPLLVEILDRIVLATPDKVHNEIKNSWLGVRYEHATDKKTLLQMLVVFTIILAFLLWRYRQAEYHRKEIASKNIELASINQLLEEQKATAQHMASHDLLTRLPNRTHLLSQLQHAIEIAKRQHTKVAVLFIDLDRFKFVNDSLGHHVGDELLLAVSNLLSARIRRSDTLARIGGDEFVLIMEMFHEEESPALVAQDLLTALKQPFHIGEHQFHISASIGIAIYPDDSDEMHTLIKQADIAMYQAKEQGRDRYRYFTQSLSERTEKRLNLENALRSAIKQEQLTLFYQPIVNLRTSRVDKAEALLRWHHPSLGAIPPDVFIPIAEDNGMIHELGLWVLRETCRQLKRWRDCELGIATVSVNVSSIQFQKPDLIDNFKKILDEEGVSAREINIEITESHLMDQTERNIAFLEALKRAGHTISVDDFGVGYSSMSYMKRLPLDIIKIDRSFISDIPLDKNDIQITQAIIALSMNLGYASVAEGVEKIEQMELLREIGCHYAQGFYYSKPLPPAEFEQRVEDLNSCQSVSL